MRKIKIALAITALAFSAQANAMPLSVTTSWSGLMSWALSMVAQRPCNTQTSTYGYCSY